MKDGGIMKNIIKSNKLNKLADKLIEIILKRNDPFTTIKIVTSSLSIQQYFKAYWLEIVTSEFTIDAFVTQRSVIVRIAPEIVLPLLEVRSEKLYLIVPALTLTPADCTEGFADTYWNIVVS